MTSNIQSNYEGLLSKVPNANSIIAVSKYSPFSDIEKLYHLGHRDFGENRIEDLESKALSANDSGLSDIRWHFIGNIQSNKISRIASIKGLFSIHSISSIKHIRAFAKNTSNSLKLFFQVNTSDEKQKGGVSDRAATQELIDCAREFSNLEAYGLMTMASIRSADQLSSARESFSRLVELRDSIDPQLKLSMGMSADFEIALELGSDYIRVGSLIFK